jgi:ABC-2 type transport system ATP-binding protein
MVVTPNEAESPELQKLDELAKRVDPSTFVKALSDYINAHRSSVPSDVKTRSVILLARQRSLQLNEEELDPASLDAAQRRLHRDAYKLLQILMSPDDHEVPPPEPRRRAGSGLFRAAVQRTAAEASGLRQPNRHAVIDAIQVSRTYHSSAFSLHPIDVTVKPKEILAITGINGSGKSTLIDILRGELAPDKGEVHYPQLTPDRRDWRAIRSKIGYVPTRSRPWRGTVREVLEYAAASHRIYDRDNLEEVDYLIGRHGLKPYENRSWSELSSGYRLRVDLALARVHRPHLLILDEPMANLDLVSQQELLFDIEQMAEQFETAVIITSQHLYEMEAIATRTIVLNDGWEMHPPDQPLHAYFEIWPQQADELKAEQILEALKGCAPNARVWLDTTICLVELPREVTVEALSAEMAKAGLPLAYAREVTKSARVEMDPRVHAADKTAGAGDASGAGAYGSSDTTGERHVE